MKRIELVYDVACPNVDAARRRLAEVLAEMGLPQHWQEWNRESALAPAHVRAYGSPTILVDGRDVTGAAESAQANCCRVYVDPKGGFEGMPPMDDIRAALLDAALLDEETA